MSTKNYEAYNVSITEGDPYGKKLLIEILPVDPMLNKAQVFLTAEQTIDLANQLLENAAKYKSNWMFN